MPPIMENDTHVNLGPQKWKAPIDPLNGEPERIAALENQKKACLTANNASSTKSAPDKKVANAPKDSRQASVEDADDEDQTSANSRRFVKNWNHVLELDNDDEEDMYTDSDTVNTQIQNSNKVLPLVFEGLV